MKLFTNLPGNLRALFGALRLLVVVFAAFWFLTLTFNAWIQKRFVDDPKLIVTVGEVTATRAAHPPTLVSASAQPGSLILGDLHGPLQADLLSSDTALVSAVRWTVLPAMVVFVVFSWWLFGSLRAVCANIEHGEVFTETNLRLVRGIGGLLIAYSLVSLVVGFWGAHVMNGYLAQHVTATGFASSPGALRFSLGGQFPQWGGFVTGLVVLVVSEAFRQGLTLKIENDLTV